MDLTRFAKPILTRHQTVHELEVPQIESQSAVYPDLNDIHQFSKVYSMNTPPCSREAKMTHLGTLAR